MWTRLRLRQPWHYKTPLLLTVLYAHAASGTLGFARTTSALIASLSTIVGIAGLAYLSNDFADRAIDQRAGKPNSTEGIGFLPLTALGAALLTAALLPWVFVLPFDSTAAWLLFAEFGLIAAYALPPLRLKERGFAGVVTDALYAHTVPAILATITYRAMADGRLSPLTPFVISLALWQLALGIRNIALHQLADHENDIRSGARTWVIRRGSANTEAWLRHVMLPIELTLFLLFLGILTPFAPLVAPSFLAHAVWVRRQRSSLPVSTDNLRGLFYAYFDPFYLRWLPLVILGSIALSGPSFLSLVLVHIVLFPDVRDSLRALFAPQKSTQMAATTSPPPPGRPVATFEDVGRSKAFCMKPWVHLFVSQFGTVVPCCITPWGKEQALGDVNEQTIGEIWNGPAMRDLRLKMLRDEKDPRCAACYRAESHGLASARLGTNFYYADKLAWAFETDASGFSPNSKPVYWDVRISNLCNLKCRICGHDSSSEWYRDAQALGLFTYEQKFHRGPKDFNRLLAQLETFIPHLEEIYLAGGEPSVTEETYLVLQRLIDAGRTNIRIIYVTNFARSEYKGFDLYKLLSRFEDVTVLASLDDTGDRIEFQRSGLRWEAAVANRKRMMRVVPRARICVTPTVSVFNVLHLPAFHKRWVSEGLIDIDDFMPHILTSPPEYSITVLPQALKERARDDFEAHIAWMVEFSKAHPPRPYALREGKFEGIKDAQPWVVRSPITGHGRLDAHIHQFKGCVSYLTSADHTHLLAKFRETCAKLDELRGEDTRAVFPELAELWANSGTDARA